MQKSHTPSRIPLRSLLEDGLPVERLYELAKREGNAKKPIYEIHKWWARRLGHIFRVLLIAASSPSDSSEAAQSTLMERFYSKVDLKGLTVLDPFMGGGTSVVESLKTGAAVIGVDIDPVAWFVTKKEVEPFDEVAFAAAFDRITASLETRLRAFYLTTDPATGHQCNVVNVFWVTLAECPECKQVNEAHPHYRLSIDHNKDKQVVFCRHCGEVHTVSANQRWFKCHFCAKTTSIDKGAAKSGSVSCRNCGTSTAIVSLSSEGAPTEKRMFALEFSYSGENGRPKRYYKKAAKEDLCRFNDAASAFESEKDSLPYPVAKIFAKNRFDSRPISHGYVRYDQLFNARQLYCLSVILKEIMSEPDRTVKEYLLLAFSDSLASNNQLVSYAFGYQKITPLFAIHGYQVPQRPVETNVWGNDDFGRGTFIRCVRKLIAGKAYSSRPFEYRYSDTGKIERVFTGESIATEVITQPDNIKQFTQSRACLLNRSSVNLEGLADESVDLVLTDPPFYDNLPYSELSDFYYQWLRLYFLSDESVKVKTRTPIEDSLLVRRKNLSEHEKYLEGLTAAMKECKRVLRREGMLVFTFHHRKAAAWQALSSALADASFTVTAVSPVRAEGVSGFHSYSGTPKWDSVICCRPIAVPNASSQGPWAIGSGMKALRNYERKWTKRLHKAKLPWNEADQASFAYSLALKEIVNSRLSDEQSRRLFDEVTAQYSQEGVSGAIPQRA